VAVERLAETVDGDDGGSMAPPSGSMAPPSIPPSELN
jgi:hypothetical protein